MPAGPGGNHGNLMHSWWEGRANPAGPTGTATIWVGVRMRFTVPGRVFAVRIYRADGDGQNHFAQMSGGSPRIQTFAYGFMQVTNSTGSAQWLQAWVRPAARVNDTDEYDLGVLFPGGGFFRTTSILGTGITNNFVQFINGWQVSSLNPQGGGTLNANANGIDVIFKPD